MTSLRFWKMVGAGNDFVMLDARDGLPGDPADLARALCPRRFAIGADGLVAVTRAAGDTVAVDFRNADGSLAGFCGNGARCTARFARRLGLAAPELTVAFPGLTVTARERGDDIEITAPRPTVLEDGLVLEVGGTRLAGRRILAGVPHAVFGEPDGSGLALPQVAEALFARRPELRDAVNVTLVRPRADGTLDVRTFERGVGETLACGSGALAAAALLEPEPGAGYDVVLWPPARVPLHVGLAAHGDVATLCGEAREVYTGRIEL